MLLRIFQRGKSADPGFRRLLEPSDAGAPIPRLLRGDPWRFQLLIRYLPFSRPYTAGVLELSEEERLRLSEVGRAELMDSFEQVIAPEFKSRLSWVWIERQDEQQRLLLCWTLANVDLATGKRFPAYYHPIDRLRLLCWQRVEAQRLGLEDPSAPEHRRAAAYSRSLPKDKARVAGATVSLLRTRFPDGQSTTPEQVREYLGEELFLEILMVGPDFVSLANDVGHKEERFRIRGSLLQDNPTDYRSELQNLDLAPLIETRRQYLVERLGADPYVF